MLSFISFFFFSVFAYLVLELLVDFLELLQPHHQFLVLFPKILVKWIHFNIEIDGLLFRMLSVLMSLVFNLPILYDKCFYLLLKFLDEVILLLDKP